MTWITTQNFQNTLFKLSVYVYGKIIIQITTNIITYNLKIQGDAELSSQTHNFSTSFIFARLNN